jgi:hypothetical protein
VTPPRCWVPLCVQQAHAAVWRGSSGWQPSLVCWDGAAACPEQLVQLFTRQLHGPVMATSFCGQLNRVCPGRCVYRGMCYVYVCAGCVDGMCLQPAPQRSRSLRRVCTAAAARAPAGTSCSPRPKAALVVHPAATQPRVCSWLQVLIMHCREGVEAPCCGSLPRGDLC